MPDKYLLEESLQKFDYMMRWTGIALDKKRTASNFHLFYIFNFILLNTDLAGAICCVINGAQKGESLNNLTYIAPCITTIMLANIKSLCYVIYSKYVFKLICKLKDLETKEKKRLPSDEKRNIIETETRFLQQVVKVINFIIWTTLNAFQITPLFMTVINYVNTKEVNPLLPFCVEYPFDAYDIKIWPFVFVKQIWTRVIFCGCYYGTLHGRVRLALGHFFHVVLVSIATLEVYGVDFIFFITSTYIRIQFRFLAYEVEKLIASSDKPQKLSANAGFKAKFEDIVIWHQQLIHCVELLEVIYSKSTLFNFVSSSALICLAGFNFMVNDDMSFVISLLGVFFMTLIQIFFLCFFGDMLTNASESVSDAVYNCNWHSADYKTAKMLLIIQIRAQKPCKLTACGFADVNFMAFSKILSTAWSYFAVLNTMYNAPRG